MQGNYEGFSYSAALWIPAFAGMMDVRMPFGGSSESGGQSDESGGSIDAPARE